MSYCLYVIDFPNKKRYFGITSRAISARWKGHLDAAKKLDARPVCKALRKYPESKIRKLVIGSRDYIHDLEAAAIKSFQTRDRRFGYNFGLGGDFNPMLGNRHTAESIAKISAASKRRRVSPESRAKTSASLKGHPVSADTRAKISAATKSSMQRADVLQKISTAKLGKPISAKARASRHGRVLSIEHRAKIGAATKGLKRSPETCARIAAAKLATWARKRTEWPGASS